MAAPTTQELQIIPKFRSNLKDLNLQGSWNSDHGLVQWLRARELKLDDAEEMIRKSMKWREANDMDNILTWKAPEVFSTLCPIEFCGFDKDNCPMVFLPFGTWDAKKIYNSGHRDSYIRYSCQYFEKLRERGKDKLMPNGQPVTQFLFIIDTKGLPLQTLTCVGAINMFMDALRMVEANYPETIKKLFVVNASRIFTALFALVKPIMTQRTIGKVEIYNNNVEKWRSALLELVDEDQLPDCLNQRKLSMIDTSVTLTANHIVATVAAGQKLPIEMTVKKAQSVLTWVFGTEEDDIGFSVTLIGSKDANGTIIPYKKVDAHLEMQEGVLVCEKAGVYTFLFDNSKSKKPRVLKYRIDVAEAEDV